VDVGFRPRCNYPTPDAGYIHASALITRIIMDIMDDIPLRLTGFFSYGLRPPNPFDDLD
jgi:hypothetical protein